MWSPVSTIPGGPRSTCGSGIPTVATVSWTIDQVRRRLVPAEVESEWSDPTGTLPPAWSSAPCPSAGPESGWPISSVPGDVTVVAVTRAGVAHLDFGDLVGQDGDLLHLMVTDTALDRFNARLVGIMVPPVRPPERRNSEGPDHEGSHRRCRERRNGHRLGSPRRGPRGAGHRAGYPDLVARIRRDLDVTWVVADACEVASLDAAGLATVDVVVAATGDDEDNLVISLLAKQEFAVPRVVARVNHPKNQWLFTESWGVDVSVVDPPAAHRPGRRSGVGGKSGPSPPVEGGHAHLVEVTLADDSPAAAPHPGRPRRPPRTPPWWPSCATII